MHLSNITFALPIEPSLSLTRFISNSWYAEALHLTSLSIFSGSSFSTLNDEVPKFQIRQGSNVNFSLGRAVQYTCLMFQTTQHKWAKNLMQSIYYQQVFLLCQESLSSNMERTPYHISNRNKNKKNGVYIRHT
jgi:hypothetical protein